MFVDANSALVSKYVETSPKVVVLKFWAEWCGPCKALKPVLDEISKEIDADFLEINVDKNSDLAQKYGIRGIPTILFAKNGQIQRTLVGNQPKSDILKAMLETQAT